MTGGQRASTRKPHSREGNRPRGSAARRSRDDRLWSAGLARGADRSGVDVADGVVMTTLPRTSLERALWTQEPTQLNLSDLGQGEDLLAV
jgi:hypothetical protein